MAYLAIYRKYRPCGFDDVYGQEHIVKTLKRQIETGRIGHAYLFSGSRGTGKTTMARIFAKAINCLNPKDGSPCGECAVCKALSNPSNLDIIEIDAASNNRVDEIRNLRETVTFPPTTGRYKVYIVDEVHMLTDQAFNALLKTLEEPPSYAVFILATTEAHKVPQTILSRCMRFDFKLISEDLIADRIKNIYDDLGKEYEDSAVHAIARAGNGSMRDALSVADICVSYGDGKLTYNDVLEVLGSSDKDSLYSLIESIFVSDGGKAIETVNTLTAKGKSIGVIAEDVVNALRNVYVVSSCGNYDSVLHLPESETKELLKLASLTVPARTVRCMELFSEIEGELKYSTHPRILFETAVIRASKPETDWNIEALMARIYKLEKEVENGEFTVREVIRTEVAPTASVKTSPLENKPVSLPTEEVRAEAKPAPEKKLTAEEFYSTSKKTKDLCDSKPMELLGLLTRRLRQGLHTALWAAFQNVKLRVEGNTLVVFVDSEGDKTMISRKDNVDTIKKMLEEYGDIDVEVKVAGDAPEKKEIDDGIDEMQRIFGNIVRTD